MLFFLIFLFSRNLRGRDFQGNQSPLVLKAIVGSNLPETDKTLIDLETETERVPKT